MHRLKPHGPRGVMLLGFGLLSLTLGHAFTRPGSGRTLAWLDHLVPVEYIGWVWVLVGAWLIVSAFRIGQSRALGAFAGVCFGWGTAYVIASVINLANGHPPVATILISFFYTLMVAAGAASFLINPAPAHVEVVVKPGPQQDGGADHG